MGKLYIVSRYMSTFSKNIVLNVRVSYNKGKNNQRLFMEERKWLRVEAIAHELDVSEGTVRGWIREGKLRGAKFGRDYRIRVEDYEKFIQERLNPDAENDRNT